MAYSRKHICLVFIPFVAALTASVGGAMLLCNSKFTLSETLFNFVE